MKKSELLFTALLLPLDLITIFLAFIVAYYLRLNIGQVTFIWPFEQYLAFVASLAPLWIVIFALAGLYSIGKNLRAWEEFASIFVGVAGGTGLVIAWPFLTRQEFFSRLVVIYLFFVALVLVWLGRFLMRSLRQWLIRYGVGVQTLVIVGTDTVAAQLVRQLLHEPQLGIELLGLLKATEKSPVVEELSLIPILGTINDLAGLAKRRKIDDLLVAQPDLDRPKILQLLQDAEDAKINFKLSPNLLDVHSANIGVSELAGVPILEYRRTPLEGWGKILKRLVDVVGALVGIVMFSPFMLATALAVKLTSKGPAIYKSERVGDDGHFYAYKFRSMRVEHSTGKDYGGDQALQYEQQLIRTNNTRNGALYKIKDDPRLTPIGAFIRKTSLDELPQFFNVLVGDMSLVGPRPHQPREVDKYERRHRKLLHIKPGLTGLAQISGRSDLDFEDEYRLDAYYIEHWSLWADLEIIIRTPIALLASRGRKAA